MMQFFLLGNKVLSLSQCREHDIPGDLRLMMTIIGANLTVNFPKMQISECARIKQSKPPNVVSD